jgi:hypothetical protein
MVGGGNTIKTEKWVTFSISSFSSFTYFKDGLTYDFDQLKSEVDASKEPNILFFCFGMFAFGSILDVIAFFMDAEPAENKISNVQDKNQHQQPETSKKTGEKQPSA